MSSGPQSGSGATTPPNPWQVVYDVGIRSFLAPIADLLSDSGVSEIIILGHDRVYLERKGRLERSDCHFASADDLLAAVNTIAQFCGKTITEQEPILDGRLPDGSRVCIVLPPVSGEGISVNIRRFSNLAVTPEFLLQNRSASAEALEFLELAVRARQNILVSGGTGSGKTTILNILSQWFDPAHRIIVIEDTRELQIQQEHVVSMEARSPDAFGNGGVTTRDMFVASLRMRPDRIIVGEIRGAEAIDMIQAMNSGHGGTLATIHADSAQQACGRLEVMALMADLGLPIESLRRQIALALNMVVQTTRLHDGRRCISQISEVTHDERQGGYLLNDLFLLTDVGGEVALRSTGNRPLMRDKIGLYGLGDRVRLTADLWR